MRTKRKKDKTEEDIIISDRQVMTEAILTDAVLPQPGLGIEGTEPCFGLPHSHNAVVLPFDGIEGDGMRGIDTATSHRPQVVQVVDVLLVVHPLDGVSLDALRSHLAPLVLASSEPGRLLI